MKTILLSTGFALGLGLLATAPSSAAPLPVHGIAAPSLMNDVACRTVTKRVRRPNGTIRVTRSRVCDARPVYRDRRVDRHRVYRPAPRPGITVRVR